MKKQNNEKNTIIFATNNQGKVAEIKEILKDKGKVSAQIAKKFAESEFEKYRVIQDRLYQSDFDRLMLGIEKNNEE